MTKLQIKDPCMAMDEFGILTSNIFPEMCVGKSMNNKNILRHTFIIRPIMQSTIQNKYGTINIHFYIHFLEILEVTGTLVR
jgi:hypothetical protein